MTHKIVDYESLDWPQIKAIYAEGLRTGYAAFMTRPPSQSDWEATHLPFGRLVAHEGNLIIGWGALTAADST